jgi:NAD(P)H-hydrate epimerase
VDVAAPGVSQDAVAAHAAEPVYTVLPPADQITPAALPAIEASLQSARAAVVGPGLGRSKDMADVLQRLLELLHRHNIPAVVDADGLNTLTEIHRWWEIAAPLVLTPHPGEMSRLTGLSVEEVRRIGCAWHASTLHGGTSPWC